MNDYNRIIKSQAVQFIKARHIKLLQALTIKNFYEVENILILLNKGQISYKQNGEQYEVAPGEILFIPGGQPTTITYGDNNPVDLHNEYLTDNCSKYFEAMQKIALEAQFENFSYITFEVKVFNAVNLFASLGIPPFVIKGNERLRDTLKSILIESSTEELGSDRMIKVQAEQLVIEIVRHIIANNLFTEKMVASSNQFKDPKLVAIFNYIKDNLGGNLSNQMLATVAHVSKDYVGQYFKTFTHVSLQDYIEYQRMEYAVKLLRTTQKSIYDISKEVGFRDTAYFCRRFKMTFGAPAGTIRKRETLMSI